MAHAITINTTTGPISGWRADPPDMPRGGLIVIQEIFGLNSHIRQVTERFAAHGYLAIAPALFDHFEYGAELSYTPEGTTHGRELAAKLGFDTAIADLTAAMDLLAGEVDRHRIGVVGYCWGGSAAFLCNTRLGLPAVSYYGGRTVPFLQEKPKAPLLLHFGANDPLIPLEHIQQHKDALPDALIEIWPTGHGFNCDQRADHHPQSARDALQRTLAFFERHLQ